MIHDLFLTPTTPVTEEIIDRSKGEVAGVTKLPQIEAAFRKIDWVRNELTPWSGIGAKSCVLNEDEKLLLERGELNPRVIDVCNNAFHEGRWRPMAWSYLCGKECVSGAEDECLACLKKDAVCTKPEERAKSWFIDMNCQLYYNCPSQCQGGSLTRACYECLCQPFANKDNPDYACLQWLCGGSELNLVCCE